MHHIWLLALQGARGGKGQSNARAVTTVLTCKLLCHGIAQHDRARNASRKRSRC